MLRNDKIVQKKEIKKNYVKNNHRDIGLSDNKFIFIC